MALSILPLLAPASDTDKKARVIMIIEGTVIDDLNKKASLLGTEPTGIVREEAMKAEFGSQTLGSQDAALSKFRAAFPAQLPSLKSEGSTMFATPSLMVRYCVLSCRDFNSKLAELKTKPEKHTGVISNWFSVIDGADCN